MGSVLSTADDTPISRSVSQSSFHSASSGNVRSHIQATADDTTLALELERHARLRQRAHQLQTPRVPERAYTRENLIELESVSSPTLEGVSHLMSRDTPGLRRRRASPAPKEQKASVLNQEMEPPGIHQVPLDPAMARQLHQEAAASITAAAPFPLTPQIVIKPRGRSRTRSDTNNNQQPSRPLSRSSSEGDISRASLSRAASDDPLLSQTFPHNHPVAQINRIADYVDGVTAARFAPPVPFQPRIGIPPSAISRLFNKEWQGYYLWKGKHYPKGTWQYGLRHTGAHVAKRIFQVFAIVATIPTLGLITTWLECGKNWGFDGSWESFACPFYSSATNEQWLAEARNRSANWTLPDVDYEQQVRLVHLTNATKEAAIDRAKFLKALHRLTYDTKKTKVGVENLWAAYNMDPVSGTPRVIDGHPLFQDLLIVAPVDMERICQGLQNTPVEVCWGELDLATRCTKRSEAILDYVNLKYSNWRWFQVKLMHSLLVHVLEVAPQTRYMDGFTTRRFNRLLLNCRLPIAFPKNFPPDKQPYLYNELFPGQMTIPRDIMKLDNTNKTVRVQLPMRVKREVENYPILPFEFDHPKTLENLNKGKYAYLTTSEAKELADILYELDDRTDILYAIVIGVGSIIVVILVAGLTLRLTIMSRTQRLNAREEELNMRQLALNRREFGTLEFIPEEADENEDGEEEPDEDTDSRKQLRCVVQTEV